jgi:hypothetical protein
MPVIAHFLQGAFAVDLFLQSPQRLIHRLAFFQSNFGQKILTSFPGLRTALMAAASNG